jgi:tetratricopeptide (TPR) repeat protein
MKNIRYSFVAIILLLIATSCAYFTEYGTLERNARKSYGNGNYDNAVMDCAQALRVNPTYEKALILIQDAHKSAVSSHEYTILRLEQSTDKFKWDQLVTEYESMLNLREILLTLPELKSPTTGKSISFIVADYYLELDIAKNNAAESHYNEGISLIKSGNIETKKQAARQFKRALHYVRNYKDALSQYEEARFDAVLRLAIVPFENKSGKRRKYGAIAESILDGTVNALMQDEEITEFLDIISRSELDFVLKELKLGSSGLINEETAVELGNIVGAHKILTGKITQIIYTPSRTVKKNITEKSRVVVGKEKYTDKNGQVKKRNIYDTVSAYITIYTRSTKATVTGACHIIDVKTGKTEWSESITGLAEIETSWAKYRGDKRALTWRQSQLIKKGEQLVPVEEEMINIAAQNSIINLTLSLKEFTK